MNVVNILNKAAKLFSSEQLASSRLDAEVLLAGLLNVDRVELYKHPDRELSNEESIGFQSWIERRMKGEPVAYITGRKEFWGLNFAVNREVLIPRPDTEVLVEEVLKEYADSDKEGLRALDVGCGSGAIAIALATELKKTLLEATDISQGAVDVARLNAEKHGVGDRISFSTGDLFSPVTGLFDCIVSNPPYIGDEEFASLSREVRDFEPEGALRAKGDGLYFHKRLISEGQPYLKIGCRIFLEIGLRQAQSVTDLIKAAGVYGDVRIRRDYGGIERCISARRIS